MNEQVKTIKFRYKDDVELAYHCGITLTADDYYTLICQAELAEELEAENERYKQALEFYADSESYRQNVTVDHYNYFSDIFFDGGEIAREALKGESE